jgi:hypothetical protein
MSQDNTQKQNSEESKPKFNQDQSGSHRGKQNDDDKSSKQQPPKEYKKDDKNSIDTGRKN